MATLPRKQCKRFDVPGDAHFLTFSCWKRLPLFNRERSCRWMIEAIGKARLQAPLDIWAWVVMPEHVHLVFLPHPQARISSLLTTMKQSVSKKAIAWLKKNAPQFLHKLEDVQPNGKKHYRFWQRGGGYDRNLRSVRDIHEKIRYVHQNPVKRGLVARAEDWPWSSAKAWKTGIDDPLPIDRESVPPLTLLDDDITSDLFWD